VLFSWRWWVVLSFIVVPWGLWIIFRKKESTHRLLFAGIFIMYVSSFMDCIGITLNLWRYPINVVPLMPEYMAFDMSVLPVTTMFLLQIFPKVSKYIKAAVYSLSASYILQPVSVWLGLYTALHWKHYYSIPILYLIYLAADYMSRRNQFARLTDRPPG
jgi:hypothetical protein